MALAPPCLQLSFRYPCARRLHLRPAITLDHQPITIQPAIVLAVPSPRHRRRPRTTPAKMRYSTSAPALQRGPGGNSIKSPAEATRHFANQAGDVVSLSTLSLATLDVVASDTARRHRSAVTLPPNFSHSKKRQSVTAVGGPCTETGKVDGRPGLATDAAAAAASTPANDDRNESSPVVATGRSPEKGVVVAGIGRVAANMATMSEMRPPSRTVKMYRNAAREYGRGCSAGQAMWK